MLSRRVYSLTSATPIPVPPVGASGISPHNDHVSSLEIGSGHVFGTAVGAPLLSQSRSSCTSDRVSEGD
jgi:hypothetical protein